MNAIGDWPRKYVRLLIVACILVVLNPLASDGLLWMYRHTQYASRELLFFGLGWSGCVVPLLALWLSWGTGSIAWRLPIVLGLAALSRLGSFAWEAQEGSLAMGLEYHLTSLLIQFVMILGLHALMMPLRAHLGWRVDGADTEPPLPPSRRLTLLHLLGWTAFVAFPLAFLQMAQEMLSTTDGQFEYWAWILFDMLMGGTVTALLALALLDCRLTKTTRAVTLICAFLAAPALQSLQTWLLLRPDRLMDQLCMGLGLALGGLVNIAILRLAGLRLLRPLPQPEIVASPEAAEGCGL